MLKDYNTTAFKNQVFILIHSKMRDYKTIYFEISSKTSCFSSFGKLRSAYKTNFSKRLLRLIHWLYNIFAVYPYRTKYLTHPHQEFHTTQLRSAGYIPFSFHLRICADLHIHFFRYIFLRIFSLLS